MREKTRSDFKDGRAGDGATLSASPPRCWQVLWKTKMPSSASHSVVKTPLLRLEEFGEI